MSNVINFSTLKRKEVKCLIYSNKEGIVITEFNQGEIAKLKETIKNPILIYNPDNKQQLEMKKVIGEIGQKTYEKGNDFTIEAKVIILRFLPILTNVILDLDEVKDKGIIKEIIDDPSDEFAEIIKQSSIIIKIVSDDYMKTIKSYSELPKEQLEKFIKADMENVKETPEEIRIKQLKKELETLENNKVKDDIKEVK